MTRDEAAPPASRVPPAGWPVRVLRGLSLAVATALLAWVIARWLGGIAPMAPDAVVVALLLGMGVRALWRLPGRLAPGVAFAGKEPLELAIVLLGLSTDLRVIAQGGPLLAASVVAATVFALGAGRLVGRWMGLTRTHALLVASGNAICGNSAIAAVATVVRAPATEVASAMAYTAVLSIGLLLALPLVGTLLGLSDFRFGALAGMTVYAVPQVLAATYPVSVRAGEVGTLVKLMRVLLLVPWLTVVAVREHRRDAAVSARRRFGAAVLPPYLVAFLALAILRTTGVLPGGVVQPARVASHALTALAMAALGLSVEPGALRAVGWRVGATATLSLALLCAVALALAVWL